MGTDVKPHVKSHEWILALSHPRQTPHGMWYVWDTEIPFKMRLGAEVAGLLHRLRTRGKTHLRERIIYK